MLVLRTWIGPVRVGSYVDHMHRVDCLVECIWCVCVCVGYIYIYVYIYVVHIYICMYIHNVHVNSVYSVHINIHSV